MKKKLCVLLAALLATGALTACGGSTTETTTDSTAETSAPADDSDSLQGVPHEGAPSDGEGSGAPPDGKALHGGGMMTENTDPEIQAVLDENADKFEQFTYEDPETGLSLEYSLYIPEDYDSSQEYPLLMYIPDSTGSGKTARELVEQYYGATVWVTEEDQAKHSSFVLVPAFSETVVDDKWNVSDQVEAAVHLIAQLQKDYSIDAKRIYTTGQSMGCMTSLYLNSKYPDLFAASLFVSGQWDVSVLQPLEGKSFFYITAGGDEKASGGQDEVMAMLDADGVAYTYDNWNAQNELDEQNAAVEALLSQNLPINMIRFDAGTVLGDGGGMEHMASFNYAYRLSAVRDWLFEQTLEQ